MTFQKTEKVLMNHWAPIKANTTNNLTGKTTYINKLSSNQLDYRSVRALKTENLRFFRIMQETIDEILLYIYRLPQTITINQNVTKIKSLRGKKSDERMAEFSKKLYDIFGPAFIVIQNLILKVLYHKLGLVLKEKQQYQFLDYIIEAENTFINSKKSTNFHLFVS